MQQSLALSTFSHQAPALGRQTGLSIHDSFIQGNPRIEILSGGGSPTPVPESWRPILKDSEILVLVPDMHMFLYTSYLDNFKFGAEPMLDFLIHTDARRQQLSRQGLRLNLHQLGDMYELCFPHPKYGRPVTVRDIRTSHPIYDEIIRLFHELECNYIVGNHDAEHRRRRGGEYSRRDGAVYLEHGYSADGWFHFSNPEHRHWRFSMKALRGIRRLESKAHQLRSRLSAWDDQRHAAIGVNSGDQERAEMPNPMDYPRRQLNHVENLVCRSDQSPRVCVIAHTHKPYLDPHFAAGECIFVDAGAWTEGRSDFVVITNAEIAICRYKRAAWPMAALSLGSAS
jgi:hypothetical protein